MGQGATTFERLENPSGYQCSVRMKGLRSDTNFMWGFLWSIGAGCMRGVPRGFPQKDHVITPTASIPTLKAKRSRFIALSVILCTESANVPW
jgi:hypothetical protein